MLHWTAPGKTETGSAGEHPAKGYPGQAHQTMKRRGVTYGASLRQNRSSGDRPAMPQKTHPNTCRMVPQTCVQGTGADTKEDVDAITGKTNVLDAFNYAQWWLDEIWRPNNPTLDGPFSPVIEFEDPDDPLVELPADL